MPSVTEYMRGKVGEGRPRSMHDVQQQRGDGRYEPLPCHRAASGELLLVGLYGPYRLQGAQRL